MCVLLALLHLTMVLRGFGVNGSDRVGRCHGRSMTWSRKPSHRVVFVTLLDQRTAISDIVAMIAPRHGVSGLWAARPYGPGQDK